MAKNNESCVRYSVFCVKIQYCDSISKFMVTCSRQLCSVLTVETDGDFVVALYSINPIFFGLKFCKNLRRKHGLCTSSSIFIWSLHMSLTGDLHVMSCDYHVTLKLLSCDHLLSWEYVTVMWPSYDHHMPIMWPFFEMCSLLNFSKIS